MRLWSIRILLILAILFSYGWFACASETNDSDTQNTGNETVVAPQEETSSTASTPETSAAPTETQEAQPPVTEEPAAQPTAEKSSTESAPLTQGENPAEEAQTKPEEKPEQTAQAPTEEPKTEAEVPPMPSAPTPQEHPSEQAPIDDEFAGQAEIKGIDTVDMEEPAGNWLFKRVWWERAESAYGKIKVLADSIADKRTQFFTKRTELDRTVFDPFYLNVGINQGEILQTVNYFINKINELRTTQGELNEHERELLDNLMNEKNSLEQLKNDVEGIMQLDHAIDDALLKMMDQINLVRNYERQAWENFKAINRELSDKKARELYLAIQTYWRNINEINGYLSNSLAGYFDGLVGKAQEQVNRIKTALEALKEKGINIKEQAALLDTCPAPAKPEVEEEIEIEPEPQRGIFGTIFYYITWPFRMIGNAFSGIFSWITSWFSPKAPILEEVEEEAVIPQNVIERPATPAEA